MAAAPPGRYSMQTFEEEEADERLQDLRSRPPDAEFEALTQLQHTVRGGRRGSVVGGSFWGSVEGRCYVRAFVQSNCKRQNI